MHWHLKLGDNFDEETNFGENIIPDENCGYTLKILENKIKYIF